MKPRTGEALVAAGVMNDAQVQICLRAQGVLSSQGRKIQFGEVAILYQFASREQVDEAVRVTGNYGTGLTPIQLPATVLRKKRIMPLNISGDTAHIAPLERLSDRDFADIIDAYRYEGFPIERIVVVPKDRTVVRTFLDNLSHVDAEQISQEVAAFCADPRNGALLTKLKEHIVFEALQMRASDIHVVRSSNPLFCWIDYRIDNDITRRHLLTVEAMSSFATSLKSDAGLDAADVFRPQDGKYVVDYHGRQIEVRLSTVPNAHGEDLAIRLIDSSQVHELGRLLVDYPNVYEWARNVANVKGKEGGLVLVTGPTGSGKTTMLASLMNAMPRHQSRIVTAEDPVEILVPLTTQTPINERIGLGYAQMMAAFMRQDPDVIVVGEMRDEETVQQTTKATETGHMVCATLHVDSVAGSIKRMYQLMPKEERTVGLLTLADHLKLVMNNRLARRLCTCAECVPSDKVRSTIGQTLATRLNITDFDFPLKRRKGCDRCEGRGYYGRVLVVSAAYFPTDAETRKAMGEALAEAHLDIASLFTIPGVEYYTKENSICHLLRIGKIDVEVANSYTVRQSSESLADRAEKAVSVE